MTSKALRGRIFYFTDDPAEHGDRAHRYHEDGLLVMADGHVVQAGPADEILPTLEEGCAIVDHRPNLICPGFIDTHIHYPQTQVIASYGAQLLDWLETYIFIEEQRFEESDHADGIARFFLAELLRNGTTTAAVYCSAHAQSADSFFIESERRKTRMIAGKVLMDRNAPDALCDTAESGYADSKALIGRWHGKGRQLYGITPRFAITSSEAQLEAAGALLKEHPDCYMQTHLSENRREIAEVKRLFPWAPDYSGVYERYGLLGKRSLFGHCIHLSESELQRLHASGSVAVFCPTSNLFIGSGLFDLAHTRRSPRPVTVALATDVGGGTSYSMLRTMSEGYKVLQLGHQNLPALEAFYMASLGNARALQLDGTIGDFRPGREADAIVLNARATEAMAHRMERVSSLEEELFLLMTLGDDRSIAATYVAGELAWERPRASS